MNMRVIFKICLFLLVAFAVSTAYACHDVTINGNISGGLNSASESSIIVPLQYWTYTLQPYYPSTPPATCLAGCTSFTYTWRIDGNVVASGTDLVSCGHQLMTYGLHSISVTVSCGSSSAVISKNLYGVRAYSVEAGDETSYTDLPYSIPTVYAAKGDAGDTIPIKANPVPMELWPNTCHRPMWYLSTDNGATFTEQSSLAGYDEINFPINIASATANGTIVRAECGLVPTGTRSIRIVILPVVSQLNVENRQPEFTETGNVIFNAEITDTGVQYPENITIYYGQSDSGIDQNPQTGWTHQIQASRVGTTPFYKTSEISGLSRGTQYFFRTYADNGSETDWDDDVDHDPDPLSPNFNPITFITPPGQVSYTYPDQDEAENISINAVLNWTAGEATESVTHRLYLEPFGTAFSSYAAEYSAETTQHPSSLTYSTEYHWRIDEVIWDGYNQVHRITHGPEWTFTAEPQPVTQPAIQNDEAINISQTSADIQGLLVLTGGASAQVWLYWGHEDKANTDEWANEQYVGNFSTDNTPLLYHLSALEAGTRYYYRFKAENTAFTDWADETSSFITMPEEVKILVPTDGFSNVSPNAYLSWNHSKGATSYNIYLGTENPPPPYKTGHTRTVFAPGFEYKQTYYWMVEAVNETGETPMAAPLSFTTKTAYTLTANTTSGGSVLTDPDLEWYEEGTVVTLTAVPSANYRFDGWTGDAEGAELEIDVTMNADKTVSAAFVPIHYLVLDLSEAEGGSVQVDEVGGIGGPVYSPPAIIEIPCDIDASIQLTAVPASGAGFAAWSGATDGLNATDNPIIVQMTDERTLVPAFEIYPKITIEKVGQGEVYKIPDLEYYSAPQNVLITAIHETGYQFDHWEGDVDPANAENPDMTIYHIDSDKSLTAYFLKEYSLDILMNQDEQGHDPLGSITVNSALPLPNYKQGEVLSIVATPIEGYWFDHWEGNLAGIKNLRSPEIQLVMDRDRTIAAIFSMYPTLSVNIVPESGGNVFQTPFADFYSVGDEVELTVQPASGFEFDRWEGNLSGNQDVETLIINRPKTVTAVFTRKVYYVTTSGDDSHSGLSWDEAFATLQKALDMADEHPEYQIWVAAGTYYPDEGPDRQDDERSNTFQLVENVQVYGGFTGTESSIDQRKLGVNVTTLSGDIQQDDSGGLMGSNNAYHVVTGASNALLDGFMIVRGCANHIYGGGGLLVNSVMMTVQNCYFFCNNASNTCKGGGLNNTGDVTLINCIFSGNTCSFDNTGSIEYGNGGAIYNDSTGTLDLINCTLSDNLALSGAGIFNNNADTNSLMVKNSILWNNVTSNETVDQRAQIDYANAASCEADHSCIHGLETNGVFDEGTNIGNNPMFVKPGSWIGLGIPDSITVKAVIRDFHGNDAKYPESHPDAGDPLPYAHFDFQKPIIAPTGTENCSGVEEGIVGPYGTLLNDGKPDYDSSHLSCSTGGADRFETWYNESEYSISEIQNMTLCRVIDEQLTRLVYEFNDSAYYPIDDKLFDADEDGRDVHGSSCSYYKDCNGAYHNFHFTTEIHTTFYWDNTEDQYFNVYGSDDDLFIYLDGYLVLDIGGIHSPRYRQLKIDTDGVVYYSVPVDDDDDPQNWGPWIQNSSIPQLTAQEEHVLDLFFAERNTCQSNLRFSTTLKIESEINPGDYHLLPGSPCIDAGANSAIVGIDTDIDGVLRRIDDPGTNDTGSPVEDAPYVDMGAFEYYVNQPPTVVAGVNKACLINQSVELVDATVTDDGLPNSNLQNIMWTAASAQSTGQAVFFPSANVEQPRVLFTEPDVYTLELNADDGESAAAASTMQIKVVFLDAGMNQTVKHNGTGNIEVPIDARITGPAPDIETVQWSVVRSPVGSSTDPELIGIETDPDAIFTCNAFGTYVLELSAAFSGAVLKDTVVIKVVPESTENTLPDVTLWAEPAVIHWPENTASLLGSVSDDGLPSGHLFVKWDKLTGPFGSEVLFGDYSSTEISTVASFSDSGVYTLLLTASDVLPNDPDYDLHKVQRPLLVKITNGNDIVGNGSPTVDAGDDITIVRSPMTAFQYILDKVNIEDPTTPMKDLYVQWYIVSGPESGMVFKNAADPNPVITFFDSGDYVLSVTVDDGEFIACDTVKISVVEDLSVITPQIDIFAGQDQVITQPAPAYLDEAAVSNHSDSEPYPLEDVSIFWSKVSGPGEVQFDPPVDVDNPATSSELNPHVSFSKPGIYMLELKIEDILGGFLLYDEIEVVVKPNTIISAGFNHSLIVDDFNQLWACGRNTDGQLGNGNSLDVLNNKVYSGLFLNRVQKTDEPSVQYLDHVIAVSAGGGYNEENWVRYERAFSLALTSEGEVYSWGTNANAALGLENISGTTTCIYFPAKVERGPKYNDSDFGPVLNDIQAISAGSHHSLALDGQGHVWSWGCNVYGQLGNGYSGYSGDSSKSVGLVGSPSDVLELHFNFDENLYDISDNYRCGKAENAWYANRNGIFSDAFRLGDPDEDGDMFEHCVVTDGTVVLNRNFSTLSSSYYGISGSQSRTVSVWIKPEQRDGTILSWGSSTDPGNLWKISLDDEGRVCLDINGYCLVTDESLLLQDWTHLVVVLPDGKTTLQDVLIYLGKPNDDIVTTSYTVISTPAIEINTTSENYLHIGCDVDVEDRNFYFGLIDELQIYSRGLTQDEIESIHNVPQDTAPISDIVAVSAGNEFSMLLDSNGHVYSFGSDVVLYEGIVPAAISKYGKLGIGEIPTIRYTDDEKMKRTPTLVLSGEQSNSETYLEDIIAISAGEGHAVALTKNKEVYIWGANPDGNEDYGIMGRGDMYPVPDNFFEPVQVMGPEGVGFLGGIEAIDAGFRHTLALDENGNVWTWGFNASGELGVDPETTRNFTCTNNQISEANRSACAFYPVKVCRDFDGDGIPDGYLGDDVPIVAITAGNQYSLALDAKGTAWAWGRKQASATGGSFTNAVDWDYIPKPMRFSENEGPVCRLRHDPFGTAWFNTIQAAIDDAIDGDEIIAYPGVYEEDIQIGIKSLIIRSVNPDDPEIVKKTIIKAKYGFGAIVLDQRVNNGVAENTSTNVTISGFTISNSSHVYVSNGSRIEPSSYGVYIDSGWIYNGSGTRTIQMNIRKNRFIGNFGGGMYIYDHDCTDSLILQSVIEKNVFQGNNSNTGSAGAIDLSGVNSVIITENMVSENNRDGIKLTDCNQAVVTNNQILRNSGYGLYLSGCDEFNIRNNLIYENGICDNEYYYGVVISYGYGNFFNNTVVNNGKAIYVECPDLNSQIALTGNIIWGRSYSDSNWIHIDDEYGCGNCIIDYSCYDVTNPSSHNINSDPIFVNIWECSNTVADMTNPTCNQIVISDDENITIYNYHLGDVIEYNYDGVPRIITDISGNTITFAPPLDTVADSHSVIFNWGMSHSDTLSENAASESNVLSVTEINPYQINDIVLFEGLSGQWFTVTSVDIQTGTITIEPALSTSVPEGTIINILSYDLNMTHDYHITSGSPCKDNGDPGYAPGADERDIDDQLRLLGSCVDIGADEYCAYAVYAGEDKTICPGDSYDFSDAEFLDSSGLPVDFVGPESVYTVEWKLISQPFDFDITPLICSSTVIHPSELPAIVLPGQYYFRLTGYKDGIYVGSDDLTITSYIGVVASLNSSGPFGLVYDPLSGQTQSQQINFIGTVKGVDLADVRLVWEYAQNAPILTGATINNEEGNIITSTIPMWFYQAGTYDIILSAYDLKGNLIAASEPVQVEIGIDFQIDAGPDLRINTDNVDINSKTIGANPDDVTYEWKQLSGPGKVTFTPEISNDPPASYDPNPNVYFPVQGTYRFQLIGTYHSELGGIESFDELEIIVGNPLAFSAGRDLYAVLDDGTATVMTQYAFVYPDDGVTIQWYDVTDGSSNELDGATSAVMDFEFNVSDVGVHVYELNVIKDGVTYTDMIEVQVVDKPVPIATGEIDIVVGSYLPVVLPNPLLLDRTMIVATENALYCYKWSQADGPGIAAFSHSDDFGQSSNYLNPSVSFSCQGTYTLLLEVFSGIIPDIGDPIGSVELTVDVLPEGSSVSVHDETPPAVMTFTAEHDGVLLQNNPTIHQEGYILAKADVMDEQGGLKFLKIILNVNGGSSPQTLYAVDGSPVYPYRLYAEYPLNLSNLQGGATYNLYLESEDLNGNVLNSDSIEFTVKNALTTSSGEPPVAAITNLNENKTQEPESNLQYSLPKIERGTFNLEGIAYHPDGVGYKIELYMLEIGAYAPSCWKLFDGNNSQYPDYYIRDIEIIGKEKNNDGYYSGDNQPLSAELGQLDLTGIENGNYCIRLTVRTGDDTNGWVDSYAKATFTLDCPLKIGNVKFSQEDLSIPVGGINLSIIRTYNSFEKDKQGDFGCGWSFSIADMDIELNEKRKVLSPSWLWGWGNDQSVRTSSNYERDVTLTLPDGQRATFQFYLEYDGGNLYASELPSYIARYASPPGVTATLEAQQQSGALERLIGVPFTSILYWNEPVVPMGGAVADASMYDFGRYVLTTDDGTQYFIERKGDDTAQGNYYEYNGGLFYANPMGPLYLSCIKTANGETIDFNVDKNTLRIGGDGGAGIVHWINDGTTDILTKAIRIEYDAFDRIYKIYAPTETELEGDVPTVWYKYDDVGNLSQVHKLIQKGETFEDSEYETITYVYEGGQFDSNGIYTHYAATDHFVVDIQDPRGLTPIRYQYDQSGRLIATVDAKGNRIEIQHNITGKIETVVDRLGNPTVYEYNERGNVVSVTNFQSETSYSYESYDRLEYSGVPLSGEESGFTNPFPDQPCVVTDTAGNSTYSRYDAQGRIIQTIDPVLNKTTNDYTDTGYLEISRQYKPVRDEYGDVDISLGYVEFEEVITTQNVYNVRNMPVFSGTRKGSTWLSMNLNYYDTQNRLTNSIQLNMDDQSKNELNEIFSNISDGFLIDVSNFQNGIHVSTAYHYFDTPVIEGQSPDQPEWIEDASGQKQYFYYNANNEQVASWTLWDDPATAAIESVRILNLSDTDAQGRLLRSIRIVDRDVQANETIDTILSGIDVYIANHAAETGFEAIVQGQTVYNSIGKVDYSIDTVSGNLTKYLYDETGNVGETVTYATESDYTQYFDDYIHRLDDPDNPDKYTGILSVSRTLFDKEGRTIVSVGPLNPATTVYPSGTETVYNALAQVSETRRWLNVDIEYDYIIEAGTGNVLYLSIPTDRIADNAWETSPSGSLLAWTTDGEQPVVDDPATMLSYSRTEYDAAGRVKMSIVLDDDGYEQPTSYEYDAAGRQIAVIDPQGHAITYNEDTGSYSGPRPKAINTADCNPALGLSHRTETYYDGSRRDYVRDARGNATFFTYDDLGRVVKTQYPPTDINGVDGEPGVEDDDEILEDDITYTHVGYDGLGRKVWESAQTLQIDPEFDDSTTTDINLRLRKKEYRYDTASRLIQVILPPVDDPEDAATDLVNPIYDYFYDDYGNQIGILDPKCRLTVFKYDHLSRQTHKYMPFALDSTQYEDLMDDEETVYTLLDAEIQIPAYEYTEYDQYGRVELVLDYKQQATGYFYNDQGQLEYTYYYEADDTPLVPRNDGCDPDRAAYIDNGNDISYCVNWDEQVHYTYDTLGRQKTVTDASGTIEYQYDTEGRLHVLDTPQGVIEYRYNLITGQKSGTNTYDAGTAYADIVAETATANNTTTYGYDDFGRLDNVNEAASYTYNAVGSRSTLTYPNGNLTEYIYNPLNRLTSLTNYQTDQKATALSSFDYTVYADGMRKQAAEYIEKASGADDHTIAYTYDNLNRLLSETVAASYSVTYTYDLAGNRKTRQVNAQNGVLDTTYTYDPDTDRLLTEVHDGPIATVAWHNDKPVRLYASANGGTYYRLPGISRRIGHLEAWFYGLPSVLSRYILIALGLLTLIVLLGPSSMVLYRRLRRMPRAKRSRLSLYHRTLCVLLAWIFLVGPDVFQQAAVADTQYSQVSTFTWADGNHTIEYDYDNNGSLISKITYHRTGPTTTEFVEGRRYEYNLQNRLAKLWDFGDDDLPNTADDELLAEYSYNDSGIRTQKIDYETSPCQLTRYLIDPHNHTGYAQVLEETAYEDDGQSVWIPLKRIYYTIGDDILSQATSTYSSGWSTSSTTYLLYDGHGSTRQLADSSGIQTNYNYDAYGTLLQDSSAESNPGITPAQDTSLLYAGEQFDTNAQMYYNRARWYNTQNGTFNRMDPYYGRLRDPESLHKYLYCHANPMNNIDPLGEMTLAEISVSVKNYVNTMYIRVTSAFAAGGTAVGRLWNSIGVQTQAFARQIFSLFPRLRVFYNSNMANRVIDFTLKFNQRVANVEVKYSIPRSAGASLDRLIGQINAMVTYGNGQAVVWTIKEPTAAQYSRLQEALGPIVYNKVDFVYGVEGLYNWITNYFGF